ncbi:2269_t:CDS:2, partial [Acaulospora colombiana]
QKHEDSNDLDQISLYWSTSILANGVSGCGKSTLGQAVAKELDIPFVDGDSLHPPENIEKMSNGIPLDDNDRAPWLRKIRAEG